MTDQEKRFVRYAVDLHTRFAELLFRIPTKHALCDFCTKSSDPWQKLSHEGLVLWYELNFKHPKTGEAQSFRITVGHTQEWKPVVTLRCTWAEDKVLDVSMDPVIDIAQIESHLHGRIESVFI